MLCRFIPHFHTQTRADPSSTSKNAGDVVITLALRTPLAKAGKGGFKDTQLDYMIYALLKQVVGKSNLDPSLVEDICCGNVRSSLWGSAHTHTL
jgi:acetyl-CoA acetyltransferase